MVNWAIFKQLVSIYILGIVILVPVGATSDSNPNNNNQSKTVTVRSGNNITLLFVKVDNPNNFEPFINQSVAFIQSIFPVADTSVHYRISIETINSTNLLLANGIDLPIKNTTEGEKALLILLGHLDRMAIQNDVDKVVGITPGEFFTEIKRPAEGWSSPSIPSAVVVRPMVNTTIAHEIAHTRPYYLCDETGQWNYQHSERLKLPVHGCPNGDRNFDGFLDAECTSDGCEATPPFQYYDISNRRYFDLMGDIVDNVNVGKWVSFDSYDAIHSGIENQTIRHPYQKVIDWRGAISYGVTAIPAAFTYSQEQITVQDDVVEGNISVRMIDRNGSLAYSINISSYAVLEASNGSVIISDFVPLTLQLPHVDNLSTIEIIQGDLLIYQRNVSQSSPIVNIMNLEPEDVFDAPFSVIWTASDDDGGELVSAVLISSDNGLTWSSIATNINQTNITIDNSLFQWSDEYVIRVMVTDGINTGAADSSPITIIPPPSVVIANASIIHTQKRDSVLEAVIANDGGQDLWATAWRADIIDTNIIALQNTSLSINEVMTVLLEQNHSIGGLKTIEFAAFDNNKSVNDSQNLSIFVGDLRIRSLEELFQNGTQRTYEFMVGNTGGEYLSAVSWAYDTGEQNITAPEQSSLFPHENITVIIENEYADSGQYTIAAFGQDSFNNDTNATTLEILDLQLGSVAVIHQQDNVTVTAFSLTNELNKDMNASWSYDSGETVFTSADALPLSQGETAIVLVENAYNDYGAFTASVNASDGRHNHTRQLGVSIIELIIQNLQKLASNDTTAAFAFDVTNSFDTDRTATWGLDTNDTGTVWAAQAIELGPDESASVILENNFTASGQYIVAAKANSTAAQYQATLNTTVS